MTQRHVGKARGLLRHPSAPGAFQHVRLAPPTALESVVQHFWIVRWDLRGGPPQVRETLPHPNVHLVIEPGNSRVQGLHTGRFTRVLEGSGGVFGIKFRPGGFHPFLRKPVSTLRNRSLALCDVLGAGGAALESAVLESAVLESAMLESAMLSQSSDAGQVEAASAFLGSCLPTIEEPVIRVGEIVDGISVDRGIRTLEDAATHWSLSVRSLQRLFNDYVGIGPKWVINRYRMHEALARLDEGGAVDWAALALELGYFDQAHFIRDFKSLVGCSPAQYTRRYPPPQSIL
jgi:AraC-like DNA-binding protein